MESPAPPYGAETVALNTHYTSNPGETMSYGHPEEQFWSLPTPMQKWFSNLR